MCWFPLVSLSLQTANRLSELVSPSAAAWGVQAKRTAIFWTQTPMRHCVPKSKPAASLGPSRVSEVPASATVADFAEMASAALDLPSAKTKITTGGEARIRAADPALSRSGRLGSEQTIRGAFLFFCCGLTGGDRMELDLKVFWGKWQNTKPLGGRVIMEPWLWGQ